MRAEHTSKKKNRSFYLILMLLIICIAALAAVLLALKENKTPVVPVVTETSSMETSKEESVPEVKPDSIVRLIGVGDNLIHEALYSQASKRAGGKGYDFTYAYEHMAEIIGAADIASINQETVMADIYELSAYPMFNSPTQLGEHLVNIGFDVFNQANNHTLDKGEKGLLSTLDFWSKQNAKLTGAYKDSADYDNIRTVTKNDITFSFIGMTELTNGLNLPQDSSVILMRTSDEAKIEERIKKAKKISDIVVVNVHWGVEYTHEPNEFQKALAKKMVDWGADIILGHHPHVIQPIEYIERADGSRGVVVYSLGNFISAQDQPVRMIGGMLDVTVTKSCEQDKVTLSQAKFLPIITHYERGFANVTNYPLTKYSDELAQKHGMRAKNPDFSLDYINQVVASVIDKQFLS